MYYTYILKSLKSGKFYFGHSENLSERLKIHNKGKVTYTRPFRPWVIHYFEEFDSRSEAYRRELFFKSKEGRQWLKENGIIP